MTKISIITACWNAQDTIEDTINSVRVQRWPDYEHIIVDGASTDNTLGIIDKNRHPNLRLISEKDRGIYDAMNKGLLASTGDLVGMLNADDFFCRTDATELLVNAAKAADRDAICAGVALVDYKNTTIVKRSYSATHFKNWHLRFGHMPPHPGFYVKRSALEKIGVFTEDLKIGGDFEWMVRFFLVHRMNMLALPETIVTMRMGGVSTSGLASMRRINQEALKSLVNNQIFSHSAMLWSKYLFKVMQYFLKPRDYPAPAEVRLNSTLRKSQ
jgi:glycosyltransferase involved in cell wall biosynthesis